MAQRSVTLGECRVDLALCNDERFLELADVDGVLLFDEPMLIALPAEHRLAHGLRLAELTDDRWMLGTAQSCPDAGRFIRACHAAGFDPDIAFHNDDYTAVLGFVGAGVGVAPIPEMVARNAPANVRICTLRGTQVTRPIVAAMPAGYQSRPARAMLDVLEHVSEVWRAAGRSQIAPARPRAA